MILAFLIQIDFVPHFFYDIPIYQQYKLHAHMIFKEDIKRGKRQFQAPSACLWVDILRRNVVCWNKFSQS